MGNAYKKILTLAIAVLAIFPSYAYADVGGDIAVIILSIVGLLTGIAGVLLNTALDIFVLNMGEIISTGFLGEPLDVAWTLVRDVVNLTFIFGLLYTGIMTILGTGGKSTKSLIASIIMGALLVNFSLFISKVVIDISNITAVEIYETMTANSQMYSAIGWNEVGLSGAFMQQMGLLDIINPNDGAVTVELADGDKSLVYVVVGSIFLIIAAFVFAAGALLLTIRFGVLVIVMALSPVAFASSVIPGIGGWSEKWWHVLLSQAFFAPAYLFMLFLTWILLATPQVTNTGTGISSIFSSGGFAEGGKTIVYFMLLIVGLITSLIVAKMMGAYGASFTTKTAGGLVFGAKAALGRATIGRLGYQLAQSNRLKNAAAQSGVGGFAARRALNLSRAASKASYDMRNTGLRKTLEKQIGPLGTVPKDGYEGRLKRIAESEVKYAKSLGDDLVLSPTSQKRVEQIKKDIASNDALLKEAERRSDTPAADRIKIEQAALARELDRLQHGKEKRSITYAQTVEDGLIKGFDLIPPRTRFENKKAAEAIRKEVNKSKEEKDRESLIEGLAKAVKNDHDDHGGHDDHDDHGGGGGHKKEKSGGGGSHKKEEPHEDKGGGGGGHH